MSVRPLRWLPLLLAAWLGLGTALQAQDPEEAPEVAPAPLPPTLPPLPARGSAAAVESRDPFHSRLLAPPAPPGAQGARPGPQSLSLLGTIRIPGRPVCAVLRVAGAAVVVRAGDRIPLAHGAQLETVEYLDVHAVEDGYLEVETGRTKWILR